MSLRHAVLGFLSIMPHSGYDLKKTFDTSVPHVWPADQSQIYRTLADLADLQLVRQEVIPREGRLDLKVYHITTAGQDELHRWLTTPLPTPVKRDPFLLQIYFSAKLTDEEVLVLLEKEASQTRERLVWSEAIYEEARAGLAARQNIRGGFYTMLTLEQTLVASRAHLAWLEQVIERVREGDHTVPDLSSLTG